jgi:hypothetical protein
MATLQIATIQGTASFAALNRSGGINPAGAGFTLWSALTPPANEGLDGSANCCIFLMPAAAGAPIPISVSGIASILPLTHQFVLQGLWNGAIVFQTPPLPSPMTPNFTVPINQLQFVGNPPTFPCRVAGNWTWNIGPPGCKTENPQETRLAILTQQRTLGTIFNYSPRDYLRLGGPSCRAPRSSGWYNCTNRFPRHISC